MKKFYFTIIIALVSWTMLSATKYAGEIFQLSSGVVNQAMGNTGLTFGASLSSAYWNPALSVNAGIRGVEAVHTSHFDGLMSQNQISIVPTDAPFSLVINHIGIDKIKLTQLENPADTLSNENRPIIIKSVSNNDLVFYAGFGRALGHNTSIGISPKVLYRSLAENTAWGFGADFGFLYEGSGSFALGANLRDLFATHIFWENGNHESANPNLDLEISYRSLVSSLGIPLHLALRSQLYGEGRQEASTVALDPISADFHAGLMINPIPELRLMGGYDIDSFTAGIGVQIKQLFIDYAFKNSSPDGLGNTQKIALGYRW